MEESSHKSTGIWKWFLQKVTLLSASCNCPHYTLCKTCSEDGSCRAQARILFSWLTPGTPDTCLNRIHSFKF